MRFAPSFSIPSLKRYIKDGFYFEMSIISMQDVIDFEILPDYKIKVALSDGKKGIFDVAPYLDKGIFAELKDYNYFRNARIKYGTITWAHGQDFSPDTIEIRMKEIN